MIVLLLLLPLLLSSSLLLLLLLPLRYYSLVPSTIYNQIYIYQQYTPVYTSATNSGLE